MTDLIPVEQITTKIFLIRGLKVMIDRDLAKLYGVETKRLNEQVRRNKKRFPSDFIFQLTAEEKSNVVANCDHLAKLKFSSTLPFVFTEHGAIMAATILNSQQAVETSIFVVRAFVRLRELLATDKELAHKLNDIEKHLAGHDEQLKIVFEAIRQLLAEDEKQKKQIGF